MKRTKQDFTLNFRDYGEITVPKGTRTTHHTACGIDESYNFVDDLSWIKPHEDGTKQSGLIHDAAHYGINIPKEFIEEV